VLERGTSFCFGTPDEYIKFLEIYEAIGIEEAFFLCAIGPETHEEVMNTISLFGKYVIPYFNQKEKAGAKATPAPAPDS